MQRPPERMDLRGLRPTWGGSGLRIVGLRLSVCQERNSVVTTLSAGLQTGRFHKFPPIYREHKRDTYFNKALMSSPSIDDAPFDIPKQTHFSLPIKFVQATPSRTATVLRILCESHGSGDTVPLHLFSRFVCERIRISKRDRKSTRLNSSHSGESRMPSSA